LFSGVILTLTVQGILLIRKALGEQLDENEFYGYNPETTVLDTKFVPKYSGSPDFVSGKDSIIVKNHQYQIVA